MAELGSVPVKIFAQVGDCDQHELGTIYVPLRARMHPNGRALVIDLDTSFDAVAEMMRQVFAKSGGDDD